MTLEFAKVGIVGVGTMGLGIAQVCAQANLDVALHDLSLDAARRGVEKIKDNLNVGVEKGKVSGQERDGALSRIHMVEDLHGLANSDVVIEAVLEQIDVKQKLFAELSKIVSKTAILATNTSSLSVTEIAAAAANPERVVGMHFFNPVHLMKLLELVRALQTSDETLTRSRALGARLKKEIIVVKDSPGFASSRLGVALGLEAIRMLEEGVGSAADIDRAMELGYGHPMGPLKLGDLVGLDIRLAIAKYLYTETGNQTFRPPQLLKNLVRAGKLGRKSGEGFYRY